MDKTIFNKIAEWKVADLPAGAVAIGAVVGGVGDAVAGAVQGVLPSAPSWAVKAGLAFVVGRYGKKLLGSTGASVGTLFLAYDAVQELVNIRGNVSSVVSGLLSKVTAMIPHSTQSISTTSAAGSTF